MASTFTPNTNYELQTTGENPNAWGDHLNDNVFSIADLNLGGRLSISVAGSSNVTPTQTQANNLRHTLTGILTGNIDYILPNKGRFFIIQNSTTGAFTVTVKPSGGTGIVVPQGNRMLLFMNPTTGAAEEALNYLGSNLSLGGDISAQNATLTGTGGVLAAVSPISPPQGRLSLSSATPVQVADVTGATSIYYVPYVGQFVPIYNGTRFVMTNIAAQLTNTTTDNTKNPAAVGNNSNYDLFVWSDSGTIRLGRGPAWSTDVARGSGAGTTEIAYLNGVFVNAVAISNGPGANLGTYVGTVRSNGTATIDVKFGTTPAAGGSNAVIGIFNQYNRVAVAAMNLESTNSWSYTTQTLRPWNNSTSNRISFIRGSTEEPVLAMFNCSTTATGPSVAFGAIGINSTTAAAGLIPFSSAAEGATVPAKVSTSIYTGTPLLGFNYVQALEYGFTGVTFQGDNNTPTTLQAGMILHTRW